jgi:hypothetical protein
MNNEIKEILDSLNKIANAEYYPEDLLTYRECKQLLDCIISLQQENEKLNNRINKCAEEILKEINKNNHLSVGIALTIRQKLIDYRELKENE